MLGISFCCWPRSQRNEVFFSPEQPSPACVRCRHTISLLLLLCSHARMHARTLVVERALASCSVSVVSRFVLISSLPLAHSLSARALLTLFTDSIRLTKLMLQLTILFSLSTLFATLVVGLNVSAVFQQGQAFDSGRCAMNEFSALVSTVRFIKQYILRLLINFSFCSKVSWRIQRNQFIKLEN